MVGGGGSASPQSAQSTLTAGAANVVGVPNWQVSAGLIFATSQSKLETKKLSLNINIK